ncbi:TPA: AAA family ATPase [Klebsiella pneumoniae]|uniref:AAA family ATPase n=1 Tax=Klebsiella pneumoniae TaxID=573 RepID=UPI000E2A74B3|nr:AAA family ATPase [Klebsiella pneumoniae]MBG1254726.1 AAA family ATPase [Klebsiella pneumoniae]SXZ25759.1 recombination protein F [Klebsiella pneumoniae]HBT9408479.1 AAA family ATPase [Klebsiella pneumoniae]HBT9574849.1 AAA family ATPase [Klebsiella pneumoniae]
MKLTKLVLENFRSFSERQEIDFSPVTLLLGPNSAGKTTILIALFYLQQILDREQCNPIYLEAMGNRRIDGFKSLVHNGDLEKVITIGIGFEPEQTIGVEYKTYLEDLSDIFDTNFIKMIDIADETEKVYVEFKIAWSQLQKTAYIKNYSICINNEFIGELSNDEYNKSSLVQKLNFKHPLLLPLDHHLWLEAVDEDELDKFSSEFEISLKDLTPSLEHNKHSVTERIIFSDSVSDNVDQKLLPPIFVKTNIGSLPRLGRVFDTNLKIFDTSEQVDFFNREIITRVLTQIFTSPLDKLNNYLKVSVTIGPLRVIPDSSFIPNPYPEQNGWFDGTSAWDKLYLSQQTNNKLLDKVSDWFSNCEKLNTDYHIVRATDLNIEVDNLPLVLKNNVFFCKKDSCQMLFPNQVGVGLTQIAPLIVAANDNQDGLVAIEQPELHIHPALQLAVGDLFTQYPHDEKRPMFLVETHSEHIILRILKRIRQTTDDELPESNHPVKPEYISVIVFEDNNGSTITRKIDITDDGDFKQKWPKGFFEERRGELF